jgi:hypothetical protein
MDMQVRYVLADNENVDAFRALALAQGAGQVPEKWAQTRGLVWVEILDAARVAARLEHQITEVRLGLPFTYLRVA